MGEALTAALAGGRPVGASEGDAAPRLRLRYEFDPYEPCLTGVGCADHDNPDCLCDVKVIYPVEVIYATDEILLGRVSAEIIPLGLRATGESLVEWACNMLGLHELALAVDAATAAPLIAARWRETARDHGVVQHDKRQGILGPLLREGRSYAEAGAYVGISGAEVARIVHPTAMRSRTFEQQDMMNKLIRGGEHTAAEIAELVGLPAKQVKNHADYLGTHTKPAMPRRLTEEMMDEIIVAVRSGLDWETFVAARTPSYTQKERMCAWAAFALRKRSLES